VGKVVGHKCDGEITEMALAATSLTKLPPGRHHDGNGLYFQVKRSVSHDALTRSWLYRYTLAGKSREMGLGPFPTISLQKARESARAAREQVKGADRVDPIEARKRRLQAAQVEAAKSITFRECALQLIAAKEREWGSAEHRRQWAKTLEDFAYPVIGSLPVSSIDTALVMKVLQPIWHRIPETADRTRSRVEAVLNYAHAHRYRDGQNPAAWRGHLKHLLANPRKIAKVVHHPALPSSELPAFFAALSIKRSIGARALAFIILTVCRAGDVTGGAHGGKPGARWDQIDWQAKVWTIPATKTGAEHRIPLCEPALALLEEMQRIRSNDYVFPGLNGSITQASLRMALASMGDTWRDKHGVRIVTHGFRSCFADWVAECSNYPRELREAALAHRISNDTERAYQRGDLLQRRAKLMAAWGSYCTRPSKAGAVVPLRATR
jgi:integrase